MSHITAGYIIMYDYRNKAVSTATCRTVHNYKNTDRKYNIKENVNVADKVKVKVRLAREIHFAKLLTTVSLPLAFNA